MLWKTCGAALIAAFLCYLLGELGFRGKRVISSFALVFFFLIFLDLAGEIFGSIAAVSIGDEGREAISAALKIIGIGQGFGICASLCSELSENGIASVITLIGKAEIVNKLLFVSEIEGSIKINLMEQFSGFIRSKL